MKYLFAISIVASLLFQFESAKAQLPTHRISFYGEKDGLTDKGPVRDVQTDSYGRIWIVRPTSIVTFNGHAFKFIKLFNTATSVFIKYYENSGKAPFVMDDEGAIFFIDGDSLVPYAYNETLEKLNPRHACYDIYFDEEENLHVSHYGTGYHIISPDGTVRSPFETLGKTSTELFTAVLRSDELPFVAMQPRVRRKAKTDFIFNLVDENLDLIDTILLSKTNIRYTPSIVQLPNQNFLLATGWGHLIEFNGEGIVQKHSYPELPVRLFVDSKNGVWIGTHEDGLHYYKNGVLIEGNRRNVVAGNFAVASAEDSEGGVWGYSSRDGVFQIRNPEHYYYAEASLQSNNIVADVAVSGNKLFSVISGNHLSAINLEDNTMKKLSIPMDGKLVASLQYDNEASRLWLSRRGEIYFSENEQWKKFDISTIKNVKSTEPVSVIRSDDPSYSLIGIYSNQLFLLKDTSIVYTSPAFSGRLTDATILNDTIWAVVSGKLHALANDSILTIGEDFEPFKKGRLTVISAFDEELCVGIRSAGCYILRGRRLVPIKSGGRMITEGHPYAVNQNEMWVFARTHNYLIQKNGENAVKNWTVNSYTPFWNTGLRRPVSNEKSIFWGMPNARVMTADFDDLKEGNLKSPLLRFTGLSLDKTVVDHSLPFHEVDYDKGYVYISYEGVGLYTKTIEYRYRMLGLNDEWITTSLEQTQYTTLPAGDYTFEVQAKGTTEVWSPSRTLQFKVFPPFWETTWFIGICVLAVTTLIYLGVSVRISVIRKEQKLIVERLKAEQDALQAQMDPHFVFNVISSAQYLLLEETPKRASTFLSMFSRSLRNTLDHTRSSLIEIRYEVQFLEDYLEMERFRFENRFSYLFQFNLPDHVMRWKIPPFVIQPFLENAIQHGLRSIDDRGELTVSFTLENDLLKVLVADNGVGREAAGRFKNGEEENRTSHGIQILKERLELYNGQEENVYITDLKNELNEALGTEVIIYIKMKQR